MSLSSAVFFSIFIPQGNTQGLFRLQTPAHNHCGNPHQSPFGFALCALHWLKCMISAVLMLISENLWLFLSGNPLCSSGTPLKKTKASGVWENLYSSIFFCWLWTHQHHCGSSFTGRVNRSEYTSIYSLSFSKRDCSRNRGQRKWVSERHYF